MSRLAQCTANSELVMGFQRFMNTCRSSSADAPRLNNFFEFTNNQWKNAFQSARASFTNAITTANNSLNALDLAGATVTKVDGQINQVQKEHTLLQSEKRKLEQRTGAAERAFLEDMYQGPHPKAETYATLQDITLGIFWLGWTLMGIALITVRIFGPGGTWRAGMIVLVIYLLASLLVNGLIQTVA